jgi:hypothetical protein
VHGAIMANLNIHQNFWRQIFHVYSQARNKDSLHSKWTVNALDHKDRSLSSLFTYFESQFWSTWFLSRDSKVSRRGCDSVYSRPKSLYSRKSPLFWENDLATIQRLFSDSKTMDPRIQVVWSL